MIGNFKNKNCALVLEDGTVFLGYGIGALGKFGGEICFNTSLTGYQEILTDPSYYKQIICFTFPHIGNVGVNYDDYESNRMYANGLICGAEVTDPSNYRALEHFSKWLEKYNVAGLVGVDTRALTNHIRTSGPQNCMIVHVKNADELDFGAISEKISNMPSMKGLELAKEVTTDKDYRWNEGTWKHEQNGYNSKTSSKYKVVAIDFGVKKNILRNLAEQGCDVIVVPADTSAKDILAMNPDGVFLSNGPGDPSETAKYTKEVVKEIIGADIPVFGICLGHQILAETLGCKTIKMHRGHRGANQPVKNIDTNKVEITSQNHGFAVSRENLPEGVKETHISLFDNSNEGIAMKDKDVFSVQHHPEASPGPKDSEYIFRQFADVLEKRINQTKQAANL